MHIDFTGRGKKIKKNETEALHHYSDYSALALINA